MAKFFLFAYERYGSSGGLGDLQGAFETLEDTERALVTFTDKDYADVGTIDAKGDLTLVAEYASSQYQLDENGIQDHRISPRVPSRWLRAKGELVGGNQPYEVVEVTVS